MSSGGDDLDMRRRYNYVQRRSCHTQHKGLICWSDFRGFCQRCATKCACMHGVYDNYPGNEWITYIPKAELVAEGITEISLAHGGIK